MIIVSTFTFWFLSHRKWTQRLFYQGAMTSQNITNQMKIMSNYYGLARVEFALICIKADNFQIFLKADLILNLT